MIEAGDKLAVTAISVAEFYRGIPPGHRRRWDEFFGALTYWDISRAAARHAGTLRYGFDRQGVPLSITDTLIAAVALEKDATLVTNNLKHFTPIKELALLPLHPEGQKE